MYLSGQRVATIVPNFNRRSVQTSSQVVSIQESEMPMLYSVRRSGHALKSLRSFSSSKALFSRENIPTFGAIVGVSALTFQLVILFPWHVELADRFKLLQKRVNRMERESERVTKKLDEVLKVEDEVKTKERIILNSSDKIMISQLSMDDKIGTLLALESEGN